MDTQDYLEINIIVASEEASEIIEAELMDLGFDSFMYKAPELKCYIQSDLFYKQAFDEALDRLSGMIDSGIMDFTSAGESHSASRLSATVVRMPSVNWNSKWEQNGFTPIVVGNVTILPIGAKSETSISIYLDPQMAFGTGHHETTRMMIQRLQTSADGIKNSSVMDLGCGTAVLALIAAKLGASAVSGIDIDAVAVRSALDNISTNGENFPVLCGDASLLEPEAYDFLLANIHKNIIIADFNRYADAIKAGGHVFLSGFYESDIPDISAAALACGFKEASYALITNSWACLDFVKV